MHNYKSKPKYIAIFHSASKKGSITKPQNNPTVSNVANLHNVYYNNIFAKKSNVGDKMFLEIVAIILLAVFLCVTFRLFHRSATKHRPREKELVLKSLKELIDIAEKRKNHSNASIYYLRQMKKDYTEIENTKIADTAAILEFVRTIKYWEKTIERNTDIAFES